MTKILMIYLTGKYIKSEKIDFHDLIGLKESKIYLMSCSEILKKICSIALLGLNRILLRIVQLVIR